jgi:hypothetical protein
MRIREVEWDVLFGGEGYQGAVVWEIALDSHREVVELGVKIECVFECDYSDRFALSPVGIRDGLMWMLLLLKAYNLTRLSS